MAHAERHNIVGEYQANVHQKAKAALKRALPKHVQRGITFQGAGCQCIVVGSNILTKQMERAQDINLIKKFQDVLQVDAQPGWFHLTPV